MHKHIQNIGNVKCAHAMLILQHTGAKANMHEQQQKPAPACSAGGHSFSVGNDSKQPKIGDGSTSSDTKSSAYKHAVALCKHALADLSE